ncbi:hypothetical protein RQP46_009970 [Phenoliferia psychrophenolica]
MVVLPRSSKAQLSLTTSGTLFHTPCAEYTCPPFQLDIHDGNGPFKLFSLVNLISPSDATNATAATVNTYKATDKRTIDFTSGGDWTVGTVVNYRVEDQSNTTVTTSSFIVQEFDASKCRIEYVNLKTSVFCFSMAIIYVYFGCFIYSNWSDRKKAKAKALAAADLEMNANVQGAADPTTSETPLLAVPK